MWRPLPKVACTLWALAVCAIAAAESQPAAPETIYTNSRQFDIPFVMGEVTRPDEAPVEVQLHVSTDRGESWQQYSAVRPQVGMFRYQAAQDGAYAFSLRSRDASGRLHPPRAPEAELVVVVDTVPPSIVLDARAMSKTTARVTWSIVEQSIKPETIRIEYQTADTSSWTPVQLSLDAKKPLEALAGKVNVDLPATTAEIRFRAVAADEAGNQSTAEATLPATSPALSPVVQARPTQHGGAGAADPANDRWHELTTGGPRAPLEERNPTNKWTPPTDRPATTLTARKFPHYDPPPAVGGEVLEELPPPLPITNTATDQVVETLPAPPPSARTGATTRPVSNPLNVDGDGTTGELSLQADDDSFSGHDTSGGPSNFDFDAEVEDARDDAPPRSKLHGYAGDGDRLPSFLPNGERPLVVDTTRFEIDYEIETIGPSGVDRVELWGTPDGGKTWEVYSVDDDNTSPLVVSTDEEGVYGFRIVVVDVAGLSGVAPQSGDLPEMWVAVDLTEPAAEISDVEAVASAGQGEMTIHWTASDMVLAARPVTLSYGASASGPWSTIAAGLDNTGRFDWQPTADVPDDVFIRLEVRDEAGNIAEQVTPQRVHLARMRPKARLRAVRPVE